MSLNVEAKKAAVAEISNSIANAQTMVIAEYRGISVESMTKLRANARKDSVYLHVLKNTLARRAVEGTSFAALADQMKGPLVYAVSEDPVAGGTDDTGGTVSCGLLSPVSTTFGKYFCITINASCISLDSLL